MITLLAIDPGETTGFVKACVDESTLAFIPQLCSTWRGIDQLFDLAYPKSVQQSQILVPKQSTQPVVQPLFHNLNVLIIEDYRIYAHKARQHIGSQVYTVKVIGQIEWLHHLCVRVCLGQGQQPPLLVYQPAGQKSQWPNRRLWKHFHSKHIVRKFNSHTRDALRHLLTYLENSKVMTFGIKEDAL